MYIQNWVSLYHELLFFNPISWNLFFKSKHMFHTQWFVPFNTRCCKEVIIFLWMSELSKCLLYKSIKKMKYDLQPQIIICQRKKKKRNVLCLNVGNTLSYQWEFFSKVIMWDLPADISYKEKFQASYIVCKK